MDGTTTSTAIFVGINSAKVKMISILDFVPKTSITGCAKHAITISKIYSNGKFAVKKHTTEYTYYYMIVISIETSERNMLI